MGPITTANSFYRNIYSWFDGLLPESFDWLAYLLTGFTIVFAVLIVLLLAVALYTWFERRVLARFQSRVGPNRWGPFGLLQPIADVIKLITKEDLVPFLADRWVFNLAPIVMFVPVALVFAVVPFGKNSYLANLNIGILFILAVTSVNTLGIFMCGWASANKYAMFGAMLLIAGSLSMVDIVERQAIPFFLVQPLGLLVFLAAASAEMSRSPFDIVEAESEIVAGHHTEYSSMKFGVIYLAEFAAPIVTGAIMTTLFLQGWRGPVLPSHLWFFIKTFIVVFLLLWVRATFPRLRVDQIMGFAWKSLFPMALINLFVIAIEVQVWPDPTTGQLWIMAAINWGVAILSVVAFSNILGQRRLRRPEAMPSPLAAVIKEAD